MGAVSQTPPPADGLAEGMKVNGKHIDELNEAFPSSRFNWSKFRWCARAAAALLQLLRAS